MYGERLIRPLTRRIIPQAVILLYHRVAEAAYDPQLLCVSPENFAGHMEVLRSSYLPGTLGKLYARRYRQPRSVVVTFDDGYADNLLHAKPILQQYQIPATMFVTSGFIGGKGVPYWDQLADLFLRGPVLPPRLALTLNGEEKSWEFGNEPPVDSLWNVLQESNLVRQEAYLFLCDHLRLSSAAVRNQVMAEIRDWSGGSGQLSDANRFMTAQELALLADDGLVEIGAHTMTHPNLALLSLAEQRSEIVRGQFRLEEISGQKVQSFAYPYGTKDNYTRDTIGILKEEGFVCACSNFAGTVWPGTDRFQLPRMLVRNWSADEFADHLARCLR